MEENTMGWLFLIIAGGVFGLAFIITALVLIGYGLDENQSWYYKKEAKTKFIWSGIVAALGLFCCIFGPTKGGVEIGNVYNKTYNYTKYEIVSIEKNSEVEGHFTLGSGYINSDKVYYFYTITDIGYKLESANYKYTYLVEDSSVTPHVQHIKEAKSYSSYYIIYCPEGTIVKEFHA